MVVTAEGILEDLLEDEADRVGPAKDVPGVTSEDLLRALPDTTLVDLPLLLLTTISTIVALVGLFLNNVAIIIGAMVVSPLLSPITGFILELTVGRPVEITGSAMVVEGRFDVLVPAAETPTPTTLQPTVTPTPTTTTIPSTIARTPKPSITILYGDDYTGVVVPTKTIAPTGEGNQTIAVILENNPNFSMFLNATLIAGMAGTLDGPGPLTAFIPTNSAFDALPPGTLDDLLKNRTALIRLLNFHLAPGTLTIANVTTQASVKTLDGDPLPVNIRPGGAVGIDGANLTLLDIPASNGMVHIVDGVLIPPGLIPVTPATTIAIPSTTKPEGTSVLVTRAGPSGALVTMEVLFVMALLGLRRRR